MSSVEKEEDDVCLWKTTTSETEERNLTEEDVLAARIKKLAREFDVFKRVKRTID
ncbi:hypothetical protein YC2023_065034 [Brassica napus]